jgi:hypothetical protein
MPSAWSPRSSAAAARCQSASGQSGQAAAASREVGPAGRIVPPRVAERRAALVDLLLEVEPHRLERRVAFVVQERPAGDAQAQAVQAEAQAEVVVFEVAVAEALVEQPDLLDGAAAQHQAQAGERRRVLQRRRLRQCVADRGATGGFATAVADRQQRIALDVVADRRDGAHARMAEQRLTQLAQHVGRRLRVVVEHQHEFAARGAQSGVDAAGEAEVAFLAQHLDARRHRAERRRRVRAAVVDQQDLERHVVALLGQQAGNAGACQVGAVEARDDDGAVHRSDRPSHRRFRAVRVTAGHKKTARPKPGG